MKQVLNYYLPDEEAHFSELLTTAGQYQKPIRDLALSKVKKFNVSIDIGANLGIWSKVLESKFKNNFAIEPFEEHINYLKLNAPHTQVFQYAVSNVLNESKIKMIKEPFDENCGMSMIAIEGNTEVNCISLDLLADKHNLPPADFIKIDVEFHELQVLQGAEKYIKSSWPVLVIEHKKRSPVIDLLKSWGYYTDKNLRIKDDYIYIREEQK